MDNDQLRRGKPTLHVAYDEATAILAGDALLTMTFEWLSEMSLPQGHIIPQLIRELARAAGSQGVIGGQVADIAAENTIPDPATLEFIHQHKTGDLIRAAVRMGAIIGGASSQRLAAITTFGEKIGLAFQIVDDILNATATPEQLGKAVGSDAQRGKLREVRLQVFADRRRKRCALLRRQRQPAFDELAAQRRAVAGASA